MGKGCLSLCFLTLFFNFYGALPASVSPQVPPYVSRDSVVCPKTGWEAAVRPRLRHALHMQWWLPSCCGRQQRVLCTHSPPLCRFLNSDPRSSICWIVSSPSPILTNSCLVCAFVPTFGASMLVLLLGPALSIRVSSGGCSKWLWRPCW